MHRAKLKVTLLDDIVPISRQEMTRVNLLKIYIGCKTCTSDITDPAILAGIEEIDSLTGSTMAELDAMNLKFQKIEKLIKSVIDSGHVSVLEHASLTFHISGVSRALTHQLVRHRIASYSQQSQRYVEFSDIPFILPETIINHTNPAVLERFENVIREIEQFYRFAVDEGIPAEDARYATPQAAASAITITMNFRSLLHFFAERCCNRAQWEIRDMASQMLDICNAHYPTVFGNAGAKCIRLGYCPEGKRICKRPQYLEREKIAAAAVSLTKNSQESK